MTRIVLAPLITALISFGSLSYGQTTDPNAPDDNGVNPRFSMMTKEVAAVCGVFLPSDIPGITEYMSLCGARFGFKIGPKTTMEPQLIAGAGKSQRYILGSLSFRGDFQLDDIIGSVYGGPDIHYATAPITDPTGLAVGEQTNLYFGAHLGGAVWWEFSENFYLRTDLQFNLNPGTSLFVGFSLVMRFDPSSGQDNSPPQ
jgi:hypothetical protein